MTKSEEYTLMLNSKLYDLKTPITNGTTIKWAKVWDHRKGVNSVSFKTLTAPPYEHKLISSQIIDLMPVANKKIYQITIKNN